MIKITDPQPILDLVAKGYPAHEIKRMLKLPVSTRQVQRIIAYRMRNIELPEAFFHGVLVRYFTDVLERDPNVCEICTGKSLKPLRLCPRDKRDRRNDTRATIEDLAFMCRRCSTDTGA